MPLNAVSPLQTTVLPTPRIVPPTPLRIPSPDETTPAFADAGVDRAKVNANPSRASALTNRRIAKPWEAQLGAQISERLVRRRRTTVTALTLQPPFCQVSDTRSTAHSASCTLVA